VYDGNAGTVNVTDLDPEPPPDIFFLVVTLTVTLYALVFLVHEKLPSLTS
jgi:hypothetical protein